MLPAACMASEAWMPNWKMLMISKVKIRFTEILCYSKSRRHLSGTANFPNQCPGLVKS